ncbi:hypothetical protein K432DRAFT_415451 [Lepidopterella palustris CBS 459.81]|uniref:Uncharacterized protein n=1 Tax=Lepidopterella palustris CBS 459.81 TaxID=1314670 RepID=A0A8E2EEE3_9PEZI|nr:hypothetical protein K432DRAFT_415451 [Lepidopterella palustris CBS 459.81]
MASFFQRLKAPSGGPPDNSTSATPNPKTFYRRVERDPNAPNKRLQLPQKCIYERQLPGNAYISAHVNRLQHGFYDHDATQEERLNNVYFVSVHFVFHPANANQHRFKSAIIRVGIHGDSYPADGKQDDWYYDRPPSNPRFLAHAPDLIYGAVSPENLQWNFSLSSSLGVSQAPVSAILNPSGGYKASYKVYDMMSIQGSLRTLQSPLGPDYDVEDGLAVWSLQENTLQRSGLPREFDFVLLVHKPDDVPDIYLSIDVDPVVSASFGRYPQWYMNLPSHQPLHNFLLDFNQDIGQKFKPSTPGKGFNFANLSHSLEEYVTMPGTTYPTNDTSKVSGSKPSNRESDKPDISPHNFNHQQNQLAVNGVGSHNTSNSTSAQGGSANRHSWAPSAPETMNVRVLLEHSYPGSSASRRYSGSPLSSQEPLRHRSIRRTRSRTGLKEYGAQQAAQELARESYLAE